MKKSLFISHMVQMKAMRYANEVPEGDLYIPHGSDERNPRPRHFHLILNSLYPTWFR